MGEFTNFAAPHGPNIINLLSFSLFNKEIPKVYSFLGLSQDFSEYFKNTHVIIFYHCQYTISWPNIKYLLFWLQYTMTYAQPND